MPGCVGQLWPKCDFIILFFVDTWSSVKEFEVNNAWYNDLFVFQHVAVVSMWAKTRGDI